MKPDISEFSYAYAITEELIRGYLPPIIAAPVFPSLIQEGQAGGGYDVMLQTAGIPVFLQFKLSDYMVRNSAEEVGRNLIETPFYRMHLRPARHSKQHQMLLVLENADNLVYYVAPAFHMPAELNQKYMARQVVQNSVFIPPNAIGTLPDDDEHHVAFRKGGPAWVLSTPRQLRHELAAESFAQAVSKRIGISSRERQLRELVGNIAQQMIRIIQEHFGRPQFLSSLDFETFQTGLPPMQQIAYLSRTFFNCECVIARIENRASK